MGKRAKSDRPPNNTRCGYDGNRPEFVPARDIEVYVANDRGIPVREKSQSPQNVNIDRIEWLYAHGKIGERQHAAAVRLETDWEKALIDPVASSVLVGAGGAPQLPNDAKVAAMKRHGAARLALGYDWRIVDLVVHGRLSIEQASCVIRIHRRDATGRLWSALHHLADHYGFPQDRDIGDAKNLRAAS